MHSSFVNKQLNYYITIMLVLWYAAVYVCVVLAPSKTMVMFKRFLHHEETNTLYFSLKPDCNDTFTDVL